MTVLYITYDGLLDPLGSSQVVPYVVGLAERGEQFEVLSFEKAEALRDHSGLADLRRRLSDAGVAWTCKKYHSRPSWPATALDVFTGALIATWRALRHPNLIVHARGYLPALMGLAAKRVAGALLVFDMRGFWVDERVEAGYWKGGSLTVACARRLERALLRNADVLVHLTSRAEEAATRLLPDATLPPSVRVPTCVDLDRFRPSSDLERARSQLGIQDGPVMIHLGTLSGWYMGEETMAVGRAFCRRTGGSFIVATKEVEHARTLAEKVGTEARIVSLPHHEVPSWLGVSDVGLALVRPGFAKKASVPTKVAEYLACGLAVVTTRGVGDFETQFEGSSVARAVDPTMPIESISRIAADLLDARNRRDLARALAEEHFALDHALETYELVYERVRS